MTFNALRGDYLAEMYLVEHDLIWVAYTPESSDKSEDRSNGERNSIIPF